MTKLKFLVLMILSTTLHVQVATADTYGDLKIVKNSKEAKILNFRDETQYIVSKKRFAKEAEAQAFCKAQHSSLDKEDGGLMLGMFSSDDKFLNESVSFKIMDVSGIMYWQGFDDKVVTMLNGKGTEVEIIPISEFDPRIRPKLPAICSKALPGAKKEVSNNRSLYFKSRAIGSANDVKPVDSKKINMLLKKDSSYMVK